MRVIIAGSRTITDFAEVEMAMTKALAAFKEKTGIDPVVTEVVSGGAAGVDWIGQMWARRRNIAVKVFPADWKKHGKAAGPIRNREMAAYADALVAVWDGESRGTHDMITVAKANGLSVYIHAVPHE